jgi:hypothetical protein
MDGNTTARWEKTRHFDTWIDVGTAVSEVMERFFGEEEVGATSPPPRDFFVEAVLT